MNNSKKRIMLLIMIVIIIIIIIFLITIILIKEKENNKVSESSEEEQIEEDGLKIPNVPSRTTDATSYYVVDNCVKFYLKEIELQDKDVKFLLNEEYMNENKITEDNIFTIIPQYTNYTSYRTEVVYNLLTDNYSMYYVKGKINGTYIYFQVDIDSLNKTSDIQPISEEDYNKKITSTIDINEIEQKEIAKKNYNAVISVNLKNEDIAKKCLDDYFWLMINDKEKAYNMLDEDYRNAKYKSFNDFEDYINNKIEEIELTYKVETAQIEDYEGFDAYSKFVDNEENKQLTMQKYSVSEQDYYTQYICIDGKDRYYIINEKYPGDYTVMLDAYTVDIPEVTAKYEKASDSGKVALNIEKVREAINAKDYGYIYGKLYDTFKQNNYPNQSDLETYLSSNLFETNTFTATSTDKQNDSYIEKINVTDGSGKTSASTETKKLTIVIKLEDNNDFVMSFSM